MGLYNYDQIRDLKPLDSRIVNQAVYIFLKKNQEHFFNSKASDLSYYCIEGGKGGGGEEGGEVLWNYLNFVLSNIGFKSKIIPG